MITTIPIIGFGLLVLIGNLLKKAFVTKKIPDVIILIGIGVLIGPVFGFIAPEDLGIVGPVFATATLVILLFDGGIALQVRVIMGALRNAILLSFSTFLMTVIIAAGLFMAVFHVDQITGLIFGCVIGGSSSAVVIPLVRELSVSESTKTTLMIESALTDVYCIVSVLSLLELYQSAVFDIPLVFLQIGSSFFVAIGAGSVAGVIWVLFRDKVRPVESVFTVPAVVCILYGITELMNGSGAIAVLFFGIILGNANLLNAIFREKEKPPLKNLSAGEVELFNQISDLLKTFYFIFVGISLRMATPIFIAFCALLVVILHVFRIPCVIGSVFPPNSEDRWIVVAMIPKGLAAAVLASIVVLYDIPHAELIETLAYFVIIFSILSASVIAFVSERKRKKREEKTEIAFPSV